MDAKSKIVKQFEERYVERNRNWWQASGGSPDSEHTDYNMGLSFPHGDRQANMGSGESSTSCHTPFEREPGEDHPRCPDLSAGRATGRYPLGVMWLLKEQGLSSPAWSCITGATSRLGRAFKFGAIEIATAIFLQEILDLKLNRKSSPHFPAG